MEYQTSQIWKLKYDFENDEYEEYKRCQNVISSFHICLCECFRDFCVPCLKISPFWGQEKIWQGLMPLFCEYKMFSGTLQECLRMLGWSWLAFGGQTVKPYWLSTYLFSCCYPSPTSTAHLRWQIMKSSRSQHKAVCVPHMILGLGQGYGNP